VIKIENIILYDWLSFTSKIDSPESIIDLLGLYVVNLKWQQTYGMHGYKDRFYYEGISIYYNGKNDGVWVEMSGEGCRAFETYSCVSWQHIFDIIIDNFDDYNITRVDVAFDDHIGVLDIDKLYRETLNCNFVSKFKDPECVKKVRSGAITCYYGSATSDIRMRCYDKAKERNCPEGEHWIRWEIQLRDDRALEFIKLGCNNIGSHFFGVINNYIRFIKPDPEQKNISRLQTAKWWNKFIQSMSVISLFTKCDLDYNIARCENYVYRMAGNPIDTLIRIKGIKKFLEELKENKPVRSQKYKQLIDTNECIELDPIQQYLEERGAL